MTNKYKVIDKINVKNLSFDQNTEADILSLSIKNNAHPKVSIIIPVFNVELYLSQCLDSLLEQTLTDFELITVDDGSSDSSLDILMDYAKKDNRITVISQNNNYAGVARNAGLTVASGKYVIFLDGDDFFESDMLEEAVKALENENSDIVYFQYKYFNVETNKDEDLLRGINKKIDHQGKGYISIDPKTLKEDIFTFVNPMPWNKMLSLDFVKNNGLRFQNLLLSNDVYFSFTSIITSTKITLLYRPLVHYRYNNSNSLRNKRDEHPFCFYECYSRLYEFLEKTNNFNEDTKKAFLNSLASSIVFTIENTFYKKNEVKLFAKHSIIPRFFKYKDDFTLIKTNHLKKLSKFGLTDSSIPEVVISFTTYPARIRTVGQTITTLIKQNYPYKFIVLWLADSQFPNKEKDLPEDIIELIKHGSLVVDWYKDIRSYKKLIPSLKKYGNEILVTVDDDLLYPEDMIERLILAYQKSPNYIHTLRAHGIVLDSLFNFRPYNKWINPLNNSSPSFFNFLTGGAGCLYPPNTLSKRVFDVNKIQKLCPLADDIWFWANAVMKGTKINLVTPTIGTLKYVPGSQDAGETLWKTNVLKNLNDKQLAKVIKEYPVIFEKLFKEYTKTSNKSFLFSIINIQKGNSNGRKYYSLRFFGLRIYKKYVSENCVWYQILGFSYKSTI